MRIYIVALLFAISYAQTEEIAVSDAKENYDGPFLATLFYDKAKSRTLSRAECPDAFNSNPATRASQCASFNVKDDDVNECKETCDKLEKCSYFETYPVGNGHFFNCVYRFHESSIGGKLAFAKRSSIKRDCWTKTRMSTREDMCAYVKLTSPTIKKKVASMRAEDITRGKDWKNFPVYMVDGKYVADVNPNLSAYSRRLKAAGQQYRYVAVATANSPAVFTISFTSMQLKLFFGVCCLIGVVTYFYRVKAKSTDAYQALVEADEL